MSLHIKICGITNAEDALVAAEAGADALGFVFARSPRQVTVEQVRVMASVLPDRPERVGVFVSEPFSVVRDAVDAARLNAVQFHRDPRDFWTPDEREEINGLCQRKALRVVQAIRARDTATLCDELSRRLEGAHQVLLDAFVPGIAGGTGKAFDWSLVETAKSYGCSVIVAGGLTPENVADAVRRTQPWGVDVSTGVESSPGTKNHAAIQEFIRNARASEGSV